MSVPFDHKAFLRSATSQPGVYQMLNQAGEIIYVGKACHLKNRLSSYFRGQVSPKTKAMLQQLADIRIDITPSEYQALLLENNLIKTHKPRFNVLLRDDKSFPYLYLSRDPFPQLAYYRSKFKPKGRYFGPYPHSSAVRDTLKLIQQWFQLRSCNESMFHNRTRPCLLYQIKRCSAPCVQLISEENYRLSVEQAIVFLEGKSEVIIQHWVHKMEEASANLAFEEAAIYRDRIAQLRQIQEQQVIDQETGSDLDVIAGDIQENQACVYVMMIRGGRVLGGIPYHPRIPETLSLDELLSQFIPQYYLNPVRIDQIPPVLLLNTALSEQTALSRVLSETLGRKVTLLTKVRTVKAQWIQLATQNAVLFLKQQINRDANFLKRWQALKEILQLERLPTSIECFDISHIQGEATVASCVSFNQKGAVKSQYRRFSIQGITPGDDYAALAQAVERHYRPSKKTKQCLDLPDILMIDGGLGQVKAVEAVLQNLGIHEIYLMGVAKGVSRKPGLEQLFLPGLDKPLQLPDDHLALHGIQQIRDEAHRFALFGHRQQRDKKRRHSSLETIPGIGVKRRRNLLKQFGGFQALRAASSDTIAQIHGIGPALAKIIYDSLHGVEVS